MVDNHTPSFDLSGFPSVDENGAIVFTEWKFVGPLTLQRTDHDGRVTCRASTILDIQAIPPMDPHQTKDSPPRIVAHMWDGPAAEAFVQGYVDFFWRIYEDPMPAYRAMLVSAGWPVDAAPAGCEPAQQAEPLQIMDLDDEATEALIRTDASAAFLASILDDIPEKHRPDADAVVGSALQRAAS